MNITENSYVAEWSHSQQQFHLHTVREMIENNLQAFAANKETLYVPVGIFDTIQEADEFTRKAEKEKGS